jgi:O-acetyl-ADP-ribose deacetylase (regulator of RNase III)
MTSCASLVFFFSIVVSITVSISHLSIVPNEHGHVCVSGLRARVCTLHGDMMQRSVDGAVNAANEHLSHGGGIAYAFVRFGGQVVQQESDAHVHKFGALPVAHTAVTGAGRLPAKHIIHVVGPVYDGTTARNDLLRRATLNVLRTARRLCLQSVALPLVSSGIFGFPKPLAARIIVDAVFEFYNNAADTTQPDESPQGRLPPIEPCDLTAAVPFQVELLDQDVESAAAFETALRDHVKRANNSEL